MQRLAREEKLKAERAKAQELATVAVLKQQMQERDAAAEAQRRADEVSPPHPLTVYTRPGSAGAPHRNPPPRHSAWRAARVRAQAKAQVVLSRAQQEETREQAARAAREAAKLKFRLDLERQMKENVTRRRNQPISEVERSINTELLDKVGTWRQTGRIGIA